MKREYLINNQKMDFKFVQNKIDFVVDEIPSREFANKGNFLILLVRKVDMTTWDMIAIFAEFLRIPAQKIGYAGLKDKNATTTQYISIDARHEKTLKRFKNHQITILKSFKDIQNIKMGDLKGNKFSINLQYVDSIEAGKIEKLARKIAKNGLPNYFGYQRFGRDEDSINQAKEMIKGDLFISDSKLKKFLISIYQSDFFNEWLRQRVILSRESKSDKLILLNGDVYISQEKKLSTPKIVPTRDYENNKLIPTGLLCGRDTFRARYDARKIEEIYDDEFLQEKGYRREAIIFPKNINCKFNKKFSVLNITFELPKGSYATVFLEAIGNKNFRAKDVKSNI